MITRVLLFYSTSQPVSDVLTSLVRRINDAQSTLAISLIPDVSITTRHALIEHIVDKRTVFSSFNYFGSESIIWELSKVIGANVVNFINHEFFNCVELLRLANEEIAVIASRNSKTSSTVAEPSSAPVIPEYRKTSSGVQCIDIIRKLSFPHGTAVECIWRQGETPVEELYNFQKAEYYIDDMMRYAKISSTAEDRQRARETLNGIDLEDWRMNIVFLLLADDFVEALKHIRERIGMLKGMIALGKDSELG